MTEYVLPAPVQRTCPDSDSPDRSVPVRILVRQEPEEEEEEEEEEDHNDGEEDSDEEDGNDDGYSE